MDQASKSQSLCQRIFKRRSVSRERLLSRVLGDFLVLALVGGAVLLAAVRGSRASPTPWYYPKDGPGESLDSDWDGVPDSQDRCPMASGSVSCAGCPEQLCEQVREQGGLAWLGSGPDQGECAQAWYGGPIPAPVSESTTRRVLLMGARVALSDVSLWVEGNLNLRLPSMTLRRLNGDVVREFSPVYATSCWSEEGHVTVSAAQFNQLVLDGGFDVQVSYELGCACCGADCQSYFSIAWRYDGVGGPPPIGSDEDGDGVPIERDRCPLVTGTAGCTDGCPLNACGICGTVGTGDPDGDGVVQCLDSDGDSVPDWQDRCPLVAGELSCGGCPIEVCQLPTPTSLQYSVGTAVWVVRGGEYNQILEDRRFVPIQFANIEPVWIPDTMLNVGPVRARIITEVGRYPGEYIETQLSDLGGVGTVNFSRLPLDGCSTAIAEADVPLQLLESGKRTGVVVRVSGFGAPYECGEETRLVIEGFGPTGLPSYGSDGDHDGIPIEQDNCPHLANADQRDCDGDGIGDRCAIIWGAPDLDGGGVPDRCQFAYGDLDLNGTVDFADIALLLMLFGEVQPEFGDLDGDQTVSMADLAMALLNFGPMP